jgi:hypothetical protein
MLLCALACAALPFEQADAKGPSDDATYIELAGNDLQITNIKKYAALRDWAIDCEKRVGDQVTLRLKFPPGITQSEIAAYFYPRDIQRAPDRKSNMIYPGMPRTTGAACILLP